MDFFNTRQYFPLTECSECDRANLLNYNINVSREVGSNQIRKLQFRTVDDAWNKDTTEEEYEINTKLVRGNFLKRVNDINLKVCQE